MTFLTEEILKGIDWRALERAVARTVSHCGWKSVILVGATGDMGADVLAVRDDGKSVRSWVIQVKAVTGGNYVGVPAIEEAISALSTYGAQSVAIATNGEFTKSAMKRRDTLVKAGYDVKLWNGKFLKELLSKWPDFHHEKRKPHLYQQNIVDKLLANYEQGQKRGQYIMATGLGKTVVAAEFTRQLFDRGFKNALVLCHSQDLAIQLDKAFWGQLKSSERTSIFFNGLPPGRPEGVTFGLYQTLTGFLSSVTPEQYDLVIIDEAHHALSKEFLACIEHLKPKFLLGMTATPWRGDGDSLDRIFGAPVEKVSLVEGMTMGFLTKVDYRIFCDNVNWNDIPSISKQKLTIRDLNKRLFLPQRDEAAIDRIVGAFREQKAPKLIAFSPSIEHAEHFARLLSAAGIPAKNISGLDRINRQKYLMAFSANQLKALVAVDVLNEGIDVPDVNILAFMRATHSRRIFIQQLGRGLRVSPGKDKVIVLDFVSDIRRLSAVLRMNREVLSSKLAPEALYLKNGFVKFDNEKTGSFIDEWIKDIADLDDENESHELTYPSMP